MGKLRAPLFSFSARAALSDALSFARRSASNIAQKTPHPTDPRSASQLTWRTMYQHCTTIWHSLTPAEKAHWIAQATSKPTTPYAAFMSACLKPNPGIYLPLIGGTMKGDIDMDTSRILNLPGPTLDQEAATKKYVDDNAGGASGEGHITILPFSYDSIGQGTWPISEWGAVWADHFLSNTSDTDGDNLSYKLYLDAATYTLLLLCTKGNSKGILDFDVDAVEVTSFDLYAAASVYNSRQLQTGIVIPTSGLKTLRLRVDGKHASSTGHTVTFHYIALWRTS